MVETARPYFEKGEIEKYLEAQQTRLRALRGVTQKLATKKREVVVVKNKNDTDVPKATDQDKPKHKWNWIGSFNRWHCKQCGAYARKRNHTKSCNKAAGPKGGNPAHHTHQLHVLQRVDDGADITACMVCGYYTQLRSRGLGKPCPGHCMNVTHIKRLRNLQHPATPHIRLTHSGRVARDFPGKKVGEPLDRATQPVQDHDTLKQLEELEQAAALAEAAVREDDLTWGLCGPSEDEGHDYSNPGQPDPGSDEEEDLVQEPGEPCQAHEVQAALSWEDLYENHCDPCSGRARSEPEAETSSQSRQEDVSTEILNELRELYRDGQQVVWPQGWSRGEREQRAVLSVPSSPVTQPDSAITTSGRAEAGALELADLLELHRDGIRVSWHTGWCPYSAAVAIHTLRASPVGPISRPETG